MLTEIRGGQRKRRPIFRAAIDVDWETQRNRRRPRIARNDFDMRPRRQFRTLERLLIGLPGGKFCKVGVQLFSKILRITTRHSDNEIRACVVLAIEASHVLDRQLFERADPAGVVMTVGMTGVDDVVQMFFAKLLIVCFAQ